MPQQLSTSECEKHRLKNIEDNKRVLAELGIVNPYMKLCITRRPSFGNRDQKKAVAKHKKRPLNEHLNEDAASDQPVKRRKSARIRGVEPSTLQLETSDDEENVAPKKTYVRRDNTYGCIPGVDSGAWWETRMECSQAGIHRPTVAGIHGDTETGAYSIALSGGYEDNIDLGECFTYTGEGGRDLKGTKANPKNLRTAPQSKDQTLTRGNLALSQSVKTGNPVRVIRGFKLPTVFAPEAGYRYDGLYTVTKCWYATGASGFGVWKFALKRCPGQPPLPFEVTQADRSKEN